MEQYYHLTTIPRRPTQWTPYVSFKAKIYLFTGIYLLSDFTACIPYSLHAENLPG